VAIDQREFARQLLARVDDAVPSPPVAGASASAANEADAEKPVEPEPATETEEGDKPEPSTKTEEGDKPEPSTEAEAGDKPEPSTKAEEGDKPELTGVPVRIAFWLLGEPC